MLVPKGRVPTSREDKKPKPFPRLELLKTMQVEAAGLIAARTKAVLIHHVKNISSAGGVVEKSVRKVLRKRLPAKYHVGQGHIVNPTLKTSPQFDVIIADNSSFPLLFKDDNGTEWFSYESVYALGEVKSSYDKSKKYIEVFSDNIRKTKTELNWPKKNLVVTDHDNVPHTLTASDNKFDTGDVKGNGGTATLTAPTVAGTYQLICKYHSQMHGTLTVK